MALFTISELSKVTQTTSTPGGEDNNLVLAENTIHQRHPTPQWMIQLKDLNMFLLSKRGQNADFYTAHWHGQEVSK
jgi:hypothetical protein